MWRGLPALASGAQASASAVDYERRLAAEIGAMLLPDREEARRVLAIVDIIMNLTLTPLPSESQLHDAA
jgi:hypothetical protein